MKKNLISAVMLLLGLTVVSSCSNEEQLQQMVNDTNSIQAVIENVAEARTSVNENYQVLWTEGDAFDVWDGENYKGTLTLSSGVGTTSGSFNGAVDAVNGMTAFFPSYNGDSQTKAYLFAETYTSQETDAPMLGSYDGSKFTFNLLTSMLRVVVADVPAGEITMTITSVGEEKLTGEAALNENGVLNVPSTGNSVVSVNFTTTENGTLTFDVPIPVQNYTSGLNVVVKSGTTEFFNKTTNPINAVAGTLYNFDASYNDYALVKTADELTAAIAAGKTQIFLGADISLEEGLIISKDQNLTINLNGKTVSQTKECTASYEMIHNKGNLTINGNGKLSFKDTSNGDPSFGWGSYTIRNEGTLVVENGTIEHLGQQVFGQHMICAIFQYSGSTHIKDGVISTPSYRSARLWSGDMTIDGGTFDGQLWLQASNNTAKLTINGGLFGPNGNDGSSVFITNNVYDVNLKVTGGTFKTKIGCSDATKTGVKGSVTGGIFTESAMNATNSNLINENYEFKENGSGYYKLIPKN